MGKQVATTFRGKCESTSKKSKSGMPKHSGNFSYATFHKQSLQSMDYRVKRAANGHLIVGDHTPLLSILPTAVVSLAMHDPSFDSIKLRWHKTINGKQYEACKRLTRQSSYGAKCWLDFEFIYREEIYTDGEFDYNFPEY